MKILVPVDFSECSYNACQYALRLASEFKAEIKLFYSYIIPTYSNPGSMFDFVGLDDFSNELFETNKQHEEERIIRFHSKIKAQIKKQNIKNVILSDYQFNAGIAEDEILSYSLVYNPDVIVMGIKGESGLFENLFGGVTQSVIDHAEFPVIAVPLEAKYKTIKNIVYAIRFDDADFVAIDKLMKFKGSFNPKIFFVYVCFGAKFRVDYRNMITIRNYVKKYKETKMAFDIVESENVLDGFDEYMQKNRIDIISIAKQKRNFFIKLLTPSFTKKMLLHTEIPLLVFHEK
ncbi:MAG: universal stress protein [Bacteroidetes bacterium]|nr:universal stress protein [Bacteroidota bacterium]